MTAADGKWFTALREGGHVTAAHLFGRRIRVASIRTAPTYDGVCSHTGNPARSFKLFRAELPASLQPARVRRAVETNAAIMLAGDIAEEILLDAENRMKLHVTSTGPTEVNEMRERALQALGSIAAETQASDDLSDRERRFADAVWRLPWTSLRSLTKPAVPTTRPQ